MVYTTDSKSVAFGRAGSSPAGGTTLCYNIFMSYRVQIKQGNLLDEPTADFIVNPSNTILSLGSGVSGAFHRACGEPLQTAMTQKLRETGKRSKGDVVVTEPGNCRKFRHVLHTCVMDYNTGAADPMPTLEDIRIILINISSILADFSATENSLVRLVMPLMGTGVGNLEKKRVLELYRAEFEKDVGFDCDVILYAHSDSDYRLMQAVLR